MKNKFEEVMSILNGENYGCVNIGSVEEFEEISKKIIGYGCFRNLVFGALVEQLKESFVSMREQGLLNSDYIFDSFCENEDYRFAFQISDILFPEVLSLGRYKKEGIFTEIDSVRAFRIIDRYDIENICDMFTEKVRSYVKANLESIHTTYEATEMVIKGTIILPF